MDVQLEKSLLHRLWRVYDCQMIDLNLREAQLFRLLVAYFGRDRVIPHMSVLSVCGGELPHGYGSDGFEAGDLYLWAKSNYCLFTVINEVGDPCLVVEFAPDFSAIVDLKELERSRHLAPLLAAAPIPLVTITDEEFSELLRPGTSLDIFTLLRNKFRKEVGKY